MGRIKWMIGTTVNIEGLLCVHLTRKTKQMRPSVDGYMNGFISTSPGPQREVQPP